MNVADATDSFFIITKARVVVGLRARREEMLDFRILCVFIYRLIKRRNILTCGFPSSLFACVDRLGGVQV